MSAFYLVQLLDAAAILCWFVAPDYTLSGDKLFMRSLDLIHFYVLKNEQLELSFVFVKMILQNNSLMVFKHILDSACWNSGTVYISAYFNINRTDSNPQFKQTMHDVSLHIFEFPNLHDNLNHVLTFLFSWRYLIVDWSILIMLDCVKASFELSFKSVSSDLAINFNWFAKVRIVPTLKSSGAMILSLMLSYSKLNMTCPEGIEVHPILAPESTNSSKRCLTSSNLSVWSPLLYRHWDNEDYLILSYKNKLTGIDYKVFWSDNGGIILRDMV